MQHRIRSAGILLKDDCILLIKVKDFSGEYWIPPGGGLEKEDSGTKSCLVREFKEETNLDVEVGDLICVREFLETHTQRYNVELFYSIATFEGIPSTDSLVGLNDESYIQSVEWIPISALNSLRIYPSQLEETVLKRIEDKCFSTHLGSYVQGEDEDVNIL
jgi:ADP-ribose pyrophosphatase YjhB (NUDIX family)